jgi:large subunit ribosomal protein L25
MGATFAAVSIFFNPANMKVIEIIGYKRANLGKQKAKRLRREANAPCVLYGGQEQVHFYTPMALLRDLVYTPDARFVHLTIEGMAYQCILQDIQFHPVSEMILHVDFLQIFDNKQVKMQIPTMLIGKAPGVIQGGSLAKKLRKLLVIAYPKDMPAHIQVDVSALELGQMVRVRDIKTEHYTIVAAPGIPVASVEIPRALRSAAGKAEGVEATVGGVSKG